MQTVATLTRSSQGPSGVFGTLRVRGITLYTCEHAYQDLASGAWAAKIPPGTYTCVRGQHILAGMTAPFTTYEVTGVEGHSGLLFHTGNTEADSSGCILLGLMQGAIDGVPAVLNSRSAFTYFTHTLSDLDTFTLEVQ